MNELVPSNAEESLDTFVNETNKQKSSKIKDIKEIENTPFQMVMFDNKYFIGMALS